MGTFLCKMVSMWQGYRIWISGMMNERPRVNFFLEITCCRSAGKATPVLNYVNLVWLCLPNIMWCFLKENHQQFVLKEFDERSKALPIRLLMVSSRILNSYILQVRVVCRSLSTTTGLRRSLEDQHLPHGVDDCGSARKSDISPSATLSGLRFDMPTLKSSHIWAVLAQHHHYNRPILTHSQALRAIKICNSWFCWLRQVPDLSVMDSWRHWALCTMDSEDLFYHQISNLCVPCPLAMRYLAAKEVLAEFESKSLMISPLFRL